MNSRFILLTFASCIIVFATIWALTAPKTVAVTTAAAAPSPAVLYADCDAVRAADAAPLRADQPGYRPALDGNMNGVACEPVAGLTDATPEINTPSAPIEPPLPDTPQQSLPAMM